MRRGIFASAEAIAVLALSAVSVYTTAHGFEFFLPIEAAWIAACAIQVVLVGTAYTLVGYFSPGQARPDGPPLPHALRMLPLVVIYGVAVAFSAFGSFVSHDEMFSSEGRRATMQREASSLVANYQDALLAQAKRLEAAVESLSSRLEAKLEHEVDRGLLSGKGAGFGPRAASIQLLKGEADRLLERVQAAVEHLTRIVADSVSPTDGGIIQPLVDRSRRLAAAVAPIIALNAEFVEQFEREAKLGKALADADAAAPLRWPAPPDLSGFSESRSYVVVLAALEGVARGERPAILALAVALMTDLLLLFVAFSGSGRETAPARPEASGDTREWFGVEAGWQQLIRQYATFASANDVRREMDLWEGLQKKVLWAEKPSRVLAAELTEREMRMVRLMERTGVVMETRTGLYVRRRAVKSLKALISQNIGRLDTMLANHLDRVAEELAE